MPEAFRVALSVHMMWGGLLLFFVLAAIFRRVSVFAWLFRLAALLMVGSGLALLVMLHFPAVFVLKGLLGLGLIGAAEAVLGQLRRGERPPAVAWALVAVLFVVVPLLGYRPL